LVIGLTGPNAAGKGEVARYLAKLGFEVHSLSDVVREEAARQGFPPEREHLIRIGNELRRGGGSGVLAERIRARLGAKAVVDSIRNPAEVTVLRGVAGFVLVGVTAPATLRFERSVARARAGDPKTLAEFEERERQENTAAPEAQQLDATFRLADRILENDGDLASLSAQIEALLAQISRTEGAAPGPR
jgi:dephospho-CoA kinase